MSRLDTASTVSSQLCAPPSPKLCARQICAVRTPDRFPSTPRIAMGAMVSRSISIWDTVPAPESITTSRRKSACPPLRPLPAAAPLSRSTPMSRMVVMFAFRR